MKGQETDKRRTQRARRVKDARVAHYGRLMSPAEALKATEARVRFVSDLLPVMLVYVDREDCCRYYNSAFARWSGRDELPEDGLAARKVLSESLYRELQEHRAEVIAGRKISIDAVWQRPEGSRAKCELMLLPYPPDAEQPLGCYLLITGVAGDPAQCGELFTRGVNAEPSVRVDDPREQLMQALQEDRFVLYAQAIQALADTVPYPRFFEVLLRLKDEQQATLPPDTFLPIAERCNLMGEIDRWVVRSLIKWSSRKQRSHPAWQPPLYSLNLATSSLCDSEFAAFVRSELDRTQYPAARLCFELPEPDVAVYPDDVRRLMDVLRPLGFRFTVQSLGRTSSSLAPLKGLTFDFLKIDRTIVTDMLTNADHLARIREFVFEARKSGLCTIAEFVKSDNTLAQLRENGIDYVQGFDIGMPGPIAQVS